MTWPDGSAGRSAAFDWQSAGRRLERALAQVEATDAPPPEEVRRRLRDRAAKLAEPLAEAGPRQVLDLVMFAIGGARYAVEAAQSEAVTAIGAMTPLPGLSRLYLGLISHRGAVYPLVDVGPLLGVTVDHPAVPTHAILVSNAREAIAIAAEAIEGFVRVDAGQIAPAKRQDAGPALVAGVSSDSVMVIDAARLLQDARLVVDRQPTMPIRGEGGT